MTSIGKLGGNGSSEPRANVMATGTKQHGLGSAERSFPLGGNGESAKTWDEDLIGRAKSG